MECYLYFVKKHAILGNLQLTVIEIDTQLKLSKFKSRQSRQTQHQWIQMGGGGGGGLPSKIRKIYRTRRFTSQV